MTMGGDVDKKPSQGREGFSHRLGMIDGGRKSDTYRGPGQLAEHLEMAWALLNWRRAKGRTRTKVWGGEEWRQAEGFVKIVMPNLGRLSPAKAWPASPSRGAPGFFSSSFGALCAWAAATFFFFFLGASGYEGGGATTSTNSHCFFELFQCLSAGEVAGI